jgi:hypothetical protein
MGNSAECIKKGCAASAQRLWKMSCMFAFHACCLTDTEPCMLITAPPALLQVALSYQDKSEERPANRAVAAAPGAAAGAAAAAAGAGADDATAKAIAFKNRLVDYDRNSAKRTTVIDDQSDYFEVDSNAWLTEEVGARAGGYTCWLHLGGLALAPPWVLACWTALQACVSAGMHLHTCTCAAILQPVDTALVSGYGAANVTDGQRVQQTRTVIAARYSACRSVLSWRGVRSRRRRQRRPGGAR